MSLARLISAYSVAVHAGGHNVISRPRVLDRGYDVQIPILTSNLTFRLRRRRLRIGTFPTKSIVYTIDVET